MPEALKQLFWDRRNTHALLHGKCITIDTYGHVHVRKVLYIIIADTIKCTFPWTASHLLLN